MTPTDVCNIALAEIGQRVQIASFNDGTPAANVARLFYTPKLQMLARSAPWDSFRGQIALTLIKAAVINGTLSADPPPSPFAFQYQYPDDCLKARFLIPTLTSQPGTAVPLTTAPNLQIRSANLPTAIPFVVATVKDDRGNDNKVILTNLGLAQLIYTRDVTQNPDEWDSLFLAAATALLGSYFINALARNQAQFNSQVAVAKNIIDQARVASANESISTSDHIPDWLQVRGRQAVPWGLGGGWGAGGFDACTFADGLSY